MSRQEIAARDRELAAIYDHIPGILFYVAIDQDGDFRFVSMSQGGLAATGLPKEQFVGRLVRHVIPPQSRELVLHNYREAVRTGRTVRWKEVSDYPAGRKIGEVAVTPLFDAAGVATHLIGIVHDITEQERLSDALRAVRNAAHSRELKLLLETATQGILSIDPAGLVVTANPALEQMFGWDPGDLVGRPVETLMPALVRNAHARHRGQYFARPRARLMGGGLHLAGQRKDGSTFPIEVSLNHVFTDAGPRAYAFVTDITEREERTAELQRRTAQLSRLASDLTLAEQHAREQIAKTLHDGLQQLLVTAALDLDRRIGRDAKQGIAGDDLLSQIKAHIDEAIAAARSLSLELFPPVLHTSGLPAALRWLANQTRSKYGISVDVAADPLANPGRKDVRTLLFESVRELLFNAVKHAQADRVAVDLALEPEGTLRILVEDAGVGFDPSELAERTTSGQVGWGLFSIRERLTLLGGRLDIDSAPSRGTRFTLIAPLGVSYERSAESALAPALRILIADDHVQVRRVYRGLLEDHRELQVVGEASDGREAVAQAHALRPDVILMDVSMPAMDGIAATRQIRAELPAIEILGLSMQPRTEPMHPIEQAGAAGFFMKGIETQALIEHLLTMHRTMGATGGAGQPPVRAE